MPRRTRRPWPSCWALDSASRLPQEHPGSTTAGNFDAAQLHTPHSRCRRRCRTHTTARSRQRSGSRRTPPRPSAAPGRGKASLGLSLPLLLLLLKPRQGSPHAHKMRAPPRTPVDSHACSAARRSLRHTRESNTTLRPHDREQTSASLAHLARPSPSLLLSTTTCILRVPRSCSVLSLPVVAYITPPCPT